LNPVRCLKLLSLPTACALAILIGSTGAVSATGSERDAGGKLDVRRATGVIDAAGSSLLVEVYTFDRWPRSVLRPDGPGRMVVRFDTDGDGAAEFRARVVFAGGILRILVTDRSTGAVIGRVRARHPGRDSVRSSVPASVIPTGGGVRFLVRTRFRSRSAGCIPACRDRFPNAGWLDATREAPVGSGATCTQVIGFSQTKQWFLDSSDFEDAVGSDQWQLLWHAGGEVQLWADPSYDGWTRAVDSPCSDRSADPDRVLLTISGASRSESDWVRDIRAAIGTIRVELPSTEAIVLQPVVGGPGHAICTFDGTPVRASVNHLVIDEAIASVIGGDVVSGDSPEVSTCSDYVDAKGHLTTSAAGAVGTSLGKSYSGS
jgi:hypothetical protein